MRIGTWGVVSLALVSACVTGCGNQDQGKSEDDETAGVLPAELPWEVVSDQGETYLPNVFYADASQTEQIMPLTLDGHMMIDRMVYPTIGNPNLYVKDDPKDSLMVVLRVEDGLLSPLGAKVGKAISGRPRNELIVPSSDASGLALYLVARAKRDATTNTKSVGSGDGQRVIRIMPSQMQIDPIASDMPEELRARRTVRMVFRGDALKEIQSGLYDLRMEIKKDGKLLAPAEWQYNAVRIFENEPPSDEYSVINVTDTQITESDTYNLTAKTKSNLRSFVDHVNSSTDPMVRNAPFVTFNGDLHNGTSPITMRALKVGWGYNDEARFIIDTLKELTVPIFLVPGNHDGYMTTGAEPAGAKLLDAASFEKFDEVIREAEPKAWPNFNQDDYAAYLAKLAAEKRPGGRERNIYTGSFERFAGGKSFATGWRPVLRTQRNYVMVDGFNQWQRAYGPLQSSFRFGRNFYVNLNTFELRQHLRSGWGFYAVNYGGGLSEVQTEWLAREVAKSKNLDTILLAHHDPRGGHKGKDLGMYYSTLRFRGVAQSSINYVMGSVINPYVCKTPAWALPDTQELSCLHDGLQEWMGPDRAFDCSRNALGNDGRCTSTNGLRYSALDTLELISKSPNVRTILLGHTHFNSLEVMREGEAVVPTHFTDEQLRGFATNEVSGMPSRGYAWVQEAQESEEYDPNTIKQTLIEQRVKDLHALYESAAKSRSLALQGKGRELAVLRMTSNARLTKQKYQGDFMMGFTTFEISRANDVRKYDVPQINKVRYYINRGGNHFEPIATVPVPRTVHVDGAGPDGAGPNNPIRGLFN